MLRIISTPVKNTKYEFPYIMKHIIKWNPKWQTCNYCTHTWLRFYDVSTIAGHIIMGALFDAWKKNVRRCIIYSWILWKMTQSDDFVHIPWIIRLVEGNNCSDRLACIPHVWTSSVKSLVRSRVARVACVSWELIWVIHSVSCTVVLHGKG